MPILTIDNEVNIANVNGVTLTVTPITAVNLSTITVSGPKGERGEAGISPSGISVETLNATGLLLSENIESTGRSLYNDIIGLSGLINSNTGFVTQSQLESTGQQAWAANQNNSINLSGDIEQTGAQSIFFASFYADSIGNNLSGNLTQTGNSLWERDSFVSGGLEARISAASSSSIASANFYANGIGINLSGNLAATGTAAILESQNYTNSVGTNLSGSLSLISNNLTLTEQSLLSIIASTGQNSWNAANNNAIALSGNIAGTGAALYDRDASISGGLEARITASSASTLTSAQIYANGVGVNLSGRYTALSGAVSTTGSVLWQRDASISGGLEARITASSGALEARLRATGQAAWVSSNGANITISGNLSQTGSVLWQRDLDISGALEARINSSAASAGSLNGLSGSINIFGTGLVVSVTSAGQSIYISGNNNDGINLSGNVATISNNLTSTGQTLLSTIASTGQNAWTVANNNALNLSGNLNATGRRAWDDAVNLSGRLFATGALIASVSGGLEARISVSSSSALTSAQTYANGIGNNLSGNLNASGRRAWDDAINLSGRLFATGALIANVSGGLEARISAASASDISTANSYANGIGVNLSGRYAAISGALSITGSALWERDLSISGGLEARMASAGTAITVTGSSTMSSANITGYGSTVVFRSGNNILISGSSSAGGGEINTASNLGIGIGVYNQKVLAELQFNSILGGTGLRVSQSGQNIVVNNPIKSSITMGMREGSTVTTGEKGRVIVGNNGFIVGWDLISKETSNLTLEVWKANKQNPIGSNNICPSLKPSLQSTQYSGSLNLAGWTTSVSDGDIMSLAVINNSASTDFTLRLDVIYI